MQKIKNERGITLITLVITIVVLLLISVPIVIKTTDVTKANKYIAFVEDITKLNESISQVYDLNSDISLIGPEYEGDTSFLIQKNVNDNFTYYIIDCDKLNGELITKYHTGLPELEYGKNNYNIDLNDIKTTDVYIINAQSRTIYYPDGIEHNGETLYRQQGDYTEITVVEDETPPTATITSFTNSTDYLFAIKAQVNITDDFSQANYGRCKYQFSTDNTPLGTDEESYTDGTIARNGKIEKVKGPGTYYLHVLATDNKGNSSETVSTNTVTVASVANYDYVTDAQGNGKEQTASLLPGTYQFECWGASGNTPSIDNNYLGFGGYSVGNIQFNSIQSLYINVGGQGQNGIATIAKGGYNGGGSGLDWSDGRGAGGGGGATHIATVSGTLATIGYEQAVTNNKLLIASGGGGGVGCYTGVYDKNYCSAGSGGGSEGEKGSSTDTTGIYGTFYGYGGTQTEGGQYSKNQRNDGNPTSTQHWGTDGEFGSGGNARYIKWKCFWWWRRTIRRRV